MTDMVLDDEVTKLLLMLEESTQNRFWESYLPDDGPFARHLFQKHVDFCTSTKKNTLCTIFGANRVGKSMLLSYIIACWAMGKYPDWWQGRKFEKPPKIWAAGQTTDLLKESLQKYVCGQDGMSGFISKENVVDVFQSRGNPGLLSRILVRHPNGISEITFKSYDQGWQRFQSGTLDAVVLDEEMPPQIFTEAITRVATTDGIAVLGFTGLRGMTPVVTHLWPEGFSKLGKNSDEDDETDVEKKLKKLGRYHTFIGWRDIPYSVLSEERRAILKSQYLPSEIKARTEGIPSIGSGMVYPVDEDEYVVEPFEIPRHWPKAFALDPGFSSKCAAVWGAWDQDSDIIYLYSEHYQGLENPTVHIDAIRRRGSWINCIIDPAGANIEDGRRVKAAYTDAMRVVNKDWRVFDAQKSWTAGYMEMYSRLSSGRLKVFNTLRNFLDEIRRYHKDDKGQIVDTPDHALDCVSGDTLVCTDAGDMRIDRIRAGMLVQTVDGLKPVIASWETGLRDVYEVTFSNGVEIVGTANHPFWVDGEGWKPLDSLRYGDIVEECEQKQSNLTELLTDATPKASGAATAFTSFAHMAMAISGFMSRSGRQLTDLSLKAATFITSTMIRWTTGLKISPVLTGESISQTIGSVRNAQLYALTPNASGRSLKHGIPAAKVVNGTVSTALKSTPNVSFASERVSNAVNPTKPATQVPPSSVIRTAKPPLYVLGVRKLPHQQTVFNLQVAETPEYYANGIRVHNCARYLCMGTRHFSINVEKKVHHKQVEFNPYGL